MQQIIQKLPSVQAFLFLLLMSFIPPPGHADTTPTGLAIMTRVDDRPDGEDRKSLMTMTLINKNGRKRIREVRNFSKDFGKDKKSVMVFLKPADVKETAFLSWEYDDPSREDDKWLYMPALKKVRRISGSSKNEYFMGSDFTYDDMGDRNVEEDTHTLLAEESVDGHDCWKVESIPVDPEDMYTRKILWINKDADMIVKAEYYDKDGLLKIYRALDFIQQDGFWTLLKSEMDDVVRQHKTVMEMAKTEYDTGVKDSLFRVSTIQRGNIR
ncbi:outer membrane lipoprotein-sorting protein [Desulfobulbus rhabdoformis]|uniref:outer membrane lipoprotein-sorting protein n=1 Tax=Desulfobulbus rhabdoformis TaxID=34032 RepID=UPI0019655BED|nr:outer membrane lipoprotein-sorting protein [Desulfobulbus rhabdoformis]MBM9616321.1 outer membrane lipoprotein-sorting protein [Desulfobulbus rhabdoformis]